MVTRQDGGVKASSQDETVLIFPPLVETNFGKIFPSCAVLAGYLATRSVKCREYDLNEEFARYLLEPSQLASLLASSDGQQDSGDVSRSAIRWLMRHAGRLYAPDGRHDFSVDAPYGWLLQAVARRYAVDAPINELDAEWLQLSGTAAVYHSFYAWCGIESRIGTDVTLVGLSLPMGPQLYPAMLLASLIRQAHPHVRIVVGGPTISLMSDADLALLLRRTPAIDAAVRFDGEFPLAELVEQSRDRSWRPDTVAGVACLLGGKLVQSEPAPGPDVNRLPAPEYDRHLVGQLARPTLGIIQARGCYWGKCDYCDFVELYQGSRAFRGRLPTSFVDELCRQVERYDVRRFSFITEAIPPNFARRVSQLIIDRGLRIRWHSFAMVHTKFDRSLFELMVASGCEYLVIGLETMIDRVLALVHKSARREDNLHFLREAHAAGIRLNLNLIPDLPTTTFAESTKALDDLRQYSSYISTVSVFPFEATRSSRIGRDPAAFGLVPVAGLQSTGQSQFATNHYEGIDPAMTAEERAAAHQMYRQFAAEIRRARSTGPTTTPLPPSGKLRVCTADLDMTERDDGRLAVTNVVTRQRLVVEAELGRRLREHAVQGTSFTVGELVGRLPDAVEVRAFERILRAGFVAEAGDNVE